MPYRIKTNNEKYCLYKYSTEDNRDNDTNPTIVDGSCHTKRADTVAMMQAIMINENKAKVKSFSTALKSKITLM